MSFDYAEIETNKYVLPKEEKIYLLNPRTKK